MAIVLGKHRFYLFVTGSMFMNWANSCSGQANHEAHVGVNQSRESQSQHYLHYNEAKFVKSGRVHHALDLLPVQSINGQYAGCLVAPARAWQSNVLTGRVN